MGGFVKLFSNLHGFHSVLLGIAALCAPLATAARADLTYVLDPGSTITPVNGATPIGPTEALTGSFVWHPSSQGNLEEFDAVSLNFASESFTLTLDKTTANDEASDTFANGTTYFGEVVDTNNFPTSPLALLSIFGSGQFVGNYLSPTHVAYDGVRLVPPNGGFYEADLTFSATLVPEPTSAAILNLAAIATFLRRARKRQRALLQC
jgi:hypothetical protein